MTHEEIIRLYFDTWLRKDGKLLSDIFAENVIYSECYGPEYRGLSQILRWFADWNLRGSVICWDIKNIVECRNIVCVEWYFCCEYDGTGDGFDGVSWIEFDEHGKITLLREFQSKAEHVFPYGQI